VIAFDDLNMAVGPRALQVEIIGALAPDMSVAYMILDECQSDLIEWIAGDLRRAARGTGGIRYSRPTDTCRHCRCWIATATMLEPDAVVEEGAEVAVQREVMLLVEGLAGGVEGLGQLDLVSLGLEPSSDRHST